MVIKIILYITGKFNKELECLWCVRINWNQQYSCTGGEKRIELRQWGGNEAMGTVLFAEINLYNNHELLITKKTKRS